MLEEGLFRALLDTQCFDLDAVASAGRNENHMAISGSQYANLTTAARWSMLWMWSFGATEIDVDFNVNVVTGSERNHYGGLGGHSDCAAGAKLTIIVANLTRKISALCGTV